MRAHATILAVGLILTEDSNRLKTFRPARSLDDSEELGMQADEARAPSLADEVGASFSPASKRRSASTPLKTLAPMDLVDRVAGGFHSHRLIRVLRWLVGILNVEPQSAHLAVGAPPCQ